MTDHILNKFWRMHTIETTSFAQEEARNRPHFLQAANRARFFEPIHYSFEFRNLGFSLAMVGGETFPLCLLRLH